MKIELMGNFGDFISHINKDKEYNKLHFNTIREKNFIIFHKNEGRILFFFLKYKYKSSLKLSFFLYCHFYFCIENNHL